MLRDNKNIFDRDLALLSRSYKSIFLVGQISIESDRSVLDFSSISKQCKVNTAIKMKRLYDVSMEVFLTYYTQLFNMILLGKHM